MDRRNFLKGTTLMAGAMCLDLPLFSQAVKEMGDAKLKVGVLSDIQLKTYGKNPQRSAVQFEKALN